MIIEVVFTSKQVDDDLALRTNKHKPSPLLIHIHVCMPAIQQKNAVQCSCDIFTLPTSLLVTEYPKWPCNFCAPCSSCRPKFECTCRRTEPYEKMVRFKTFVTTPFQVNSYHQVTTYHTGPSTKTYSLKIPSQNLYTSMILTN